MFRVTSILNPLTGGATTTEYQWEKRKTLADYLGYEGEAVIHCGGSVVMLPITEIFPARAEEYVVMLIPAGGDKQTWRVLGYTAMSALMFAGGAAPAGTWLAKYGGAVAFVGGNLINLFLQDKEKDQSTSQSYSWQHKSSLTAAHGLAMPVIYGKTRVRPTLKNRYVTVEGDKQVLYALYGLAAHKVDERTLPNANQAAILGNGTEFYWSATPGQTFLWRDSGAFPVGHGTASFAEDIIINGRAIGDYNADVDWETRPGLPEQTVIEGFDATYANHAQDALLYVNAPAPDWSKMALTYRGALKSVEWAEHSMSFKGTEYIVQARSAIVLYPYGLYYIYFDTDTGIVDPDTNIARYQIAASLVGKPNAHIIATVNSDMSNGDIKRRTKTLPDDDTWFGMSTGLTDAHNIEIVFTLPRGLYGSRTDDDDGSLKLGKATCQFFAQYREVYTDTWFNFAFTAFDHAEGKGDYYETDTSTGIKIGHISRKKTDAFSVSIAAIPKNPDAYLDPGKVYEIRVGANSFCEVRLVNVATVVYGEENADGSTPGFTYPGEPLLGIKALASGQISGDLDVQVDVERSKVWVYSTRTDSWVQVAANNHAWAVYDILAQGHPDHPAYPTYGNDNAEAIYGCGIDHTRIDFESFHEWAQNIYDIGDAEGFSYELNIVFDTFMTAWDAILRICQEGRGMVYPIGTKIYAFVDKPADTSQIFTMGNIQTDTFVQKFMGSANKANMIEASYFDSENNYTKTTLAARTANWDSSTDLSTPVSITLYGTTTFEQAWYLSRILLIGNELLNNVVSFGVDVDALAVQAGDVVEVGHDVLGVGLSGRIVGFDDVNNIATLDRAVVSATGYTLTVRHSDGTRETKATVTVGMVSAVEFSSPWTVDPAPYDPYSFGASGAHTKQYRVASISRTSELMRMLTLVQYDPALYGEYVEGGTIPIPKPVPVSPSESAAVLNLASNLRLQEVLSKNRTTGEYESSIVVLWDTESGDPRGMWEVWFRDVDVSDIDWQGEWDETETYNQFDKVEHDGSAYVSLVEGNIGATPGEETII